MTTQPDTHSTPPSPREMARAFTPALTELVEDAGFPAAISASAIAARTLQD